jgi:hypothetical protein
MVQQFITDLRATITEGELIIETPPKKEGNAITALLGVKKAA